MYKKIPILVESLDSIAEAEKMLEMGIEIEIEERTSECFFEVSDVSFYYENDNNTSIFFRNGDSVVTTMSIDKFNEFVRL